MILFFSNTIEDDLIRLDEDESRHCIKVLRLGKNDTIYITDGEGHLFEACISDIDSGRVLAKILKTSESPELRGFRLHIAIAPTKNSDRLEWFLEKATEIGIDEITPVFCTHSERNRINIERARKILISAVKQSLKTRLPRLNEGISYKDFIVKPHPGRKLIASCISGSEQQIQYACAKGDEVVVLIGPEGDFTDSEIQTAIKAGFVQVSLGESRLRTETAGVYVTAAVNLINRIREIKS
ncbi:MAG: 16S rRNA (uracil(1498)-N(3))-methyltransferase [Bacteroidetes bacterium]|nr:16S rRNA (uracil(1498)-N(3))-methyltransferase [Bacteroidota bacterium]